MVYHVESHFNYHIENNGSKELVYIFIFGKILYKGFNAPNLGTELTWKTSVTSDRVIITSFVHSVLPCMRRSYFTAYFNTILYIHIQ